MTIESSLTGYRRETVTGATGGYQLPALPPGTYTVSMAKSGFNTARFDRVTLTVGQSRTLDAQLSVGAISTSVEVAADVTPLDQ